MRKNDSLNISEAHDAGASTVVNTTYGQLSNSDKRNQNVNAKEPVWKCRYVVTLIAILIHLLTSTHKTVMSVAIVAMVNHTAVEQKSKIKSDSCPNLIMNSTGDVSTNSFKKEGEFIWSPETQGYIFSCLFFGQLIALLPSGRMAERYGCKSMIVGTLLLINILTMLILPLAQLGAPAVIAIQTLRGILLAIPNVSLAILIANWSPKKERGFFYSLLQPARFLGPALGHIFSGYISESPAGWPYVFYVVGALGLILTAYVFFFIAEYPSEHSRISKAELDYILSQQESKLSKRRPKLPWRQMLTSVPLYALLLAIFGRMWASSQFGIVHSTFLGTILHYPIGKNGLFSAIPLFLAAVTGTVASLISGFIEKREIISVDILRKFWIMISNLMYSLCLFGMYIAGCRKEISEIFSILSMGLNGIGTPGAYVVIQDMSPTFAGTISSLCSIFGNLPPILLPLIVGYLTNEMQTLGQWNKIFFISIGIVMSSGIIFAIFGSAKIQPWNFVNEEEKENDSKQRGNKNGDELTRF